MKHLASLRDYIETLRELSEMQEIDAEVDWNLEIGAIFPGWLRDSLVIGAA